MYKLVPHDTLSQEMQLILICSKAAFSVNTQSNNLSNNIDSEKLYKLLTYHSIRTVFLKGITKIDSSLIAHEYLQQIKQDCHQISIRGLLNTQELLRLIKKFNSKNVLIIPYKGANLALTYFGDLGLRESSDIDIFLQLKDINKLKKILLTEGYQTDDFPNMAHEKLFWKLNCELSFRFEDSINNKYFHVEPHYSSNIAADGIKTLTFEDFKNNLQKSNIGGVPITTLSNTDNLLLILTHHAVKEGWSKLKYILDIHQIVHKDREAIDWKYLISKIKYIGIQDHVLVGFCLTHCLFYTQFPNDIATLFSNTKIKNLTKERLKELEQFERSHYHRHLKSFMFNLRCRNNFLSKLKLIFYKISYPTGGDIAIIALPKYLWFLYSIIRIFRLVPKFFKK